MNWLKNLVVSIRRGTYKHVVQEHKVTHRQWDILLVLYKQYEKISQEISGHLSVPEISELTQEKLSDFTLYSELRELQVAGLVTNVEEFIKIGRGKIRAVKWRTVLETQMEMQVILEL